MPREEHGVVVSSKSIPDDRNYEVKVRLDRDGKIVTVRFPNAWKVGDKIRVDGRN